MKLLLRRDQKTGLLGRSITFTLNVRADLSPEESANIKKYKLGDSVLYERETMGRSSTRNPALNPVCGHFFILPRQDTRPCSDRWHIEFPPDASVNKSAVLDYWFK